MIVIISKRKIKSKLYKLYKNSHNVYTYKIDFKKHHKVVMEWSCSNNIKKDLTDITEVVTIQYKGVKNGIII